MRDSFGSRRRIELSGQAALLKVASGRAYVDRNRDRQRYYRAAYCVLANRDDGRCAAPGFGEP